MWDSERFCSPTWGGGVLFTTRQNFTLRKCLLRAHGNFFYICNVLGGVIFGMSWEASCFRAKESDSIFASVINGHTFYIQGVLPPHSIAPCHNRTPGLRPPILAFSLLFLSPSFVSTNLLPLMMGPPWSRTSVTIGGGLSPH